MTSSTRLTVPLLNVQVSSPQPEVLDDWVQRNIGSPETKVLAGHNLHSAYLWHTDARFRSFYDAPGLILIDGFPVLLCAWLGAGANLGLKRIGSTDWLPQVLKMLDGRRVAVVGASAMANGSFCTELLGHSPSATVRGWHGEDWSSVRSVSVAADLLTFDPEFTLLALGMPRQEIYAGELISSGLSGLVATIGGAIDQLTGVQRNAPRWLGAVGLEWLWRLATQPRRLARRYLVEPWLLAAVLIRRSWRDRVWGLNR